MLSAVACAGPSGLLEMPVADVLGHHEANVGFSTTCTAGVMTYSHSYQFGLGDCFEFGADTDLLGHSTVNAKVQLYASPKSGKFALSAGVMNVLLQGPDTTRYVVARQDFGAFRLHAGYEWALDNHFVCGIDAPVNKALTGVLEYSTGDSAHGWAGFFWNSPVKGLSFTYGIGLWNDKHAAVRHNPGLCYSYKW